MTAWPFRLEPLTAEHKRSDFRSGDEALDCYFKTQVTQDIRRRVANCFVAVENETLIIAGYYTLSASSISLTDLPADEAKRLPRYPTVPAVRIGRLAVDERFRGRGLGQSLIVNAVQRTIADAAAAFALLVDAKNERAAAFYQHVGFRPIAERPMMLFLPLATAQTTLLTSR